ncbi:hypothetical protein [Limnobacter sp.]|uniref:AbiU2 domain-containing protein n=1 Tax=Limnobacter sp. TaxID=2003368 RepID=UPI00258D3AA7|nr:hypothetical protein [Limnobacter sp.]
MATSSLDFATELELFRTEAESAIQFFYAWDATHAMAAVDPKVRRLLNEAPLFWNTSLGALQASTLVALGRVFDPAPNNHSVTRLLNSAHANLTMFSKQKLSDRKRAQSTNADEWLPEYLNTVYEPTGDDFRRLKKHLSNRRKIYEEKYRPLRHMVFAHRGVATQDEVADLFAKTNIRELQQLLVFLRRLHQALWELYFNGRKPVLRPSRYSVQRMLDAPFPNPSRGTLQERMVNEVKVFLRTHSKDA